MTAYCLPSLSVSRLSPLCFGHSRFGLGTQKALSGFSYAQILVNGLSTIGWDVTSGLHHPGCYVSQLRAIFVSFIPDFEVPSFFPSFSTWAIESF